MSTQTTINAPRGFPDTLLSASDMQHVGALIIHDHVASLTPWLLEYFICKKFNAAILGIEEGKLLCSRRWK